MAFKEKARKPAVGCLVDLGCGGGYYLATACDKIMAHPTSILGGIGVVLNRYNFYGTMKVGNVNPQPVKAKAAPKIDLEYPFGELREEGKGMLMALADEPYDRFRRVVKQGRPAVKGDEGTFDGRVFSARQGLKVGLVDQVGYLPDGVELARQLARCPGAGTVLLHRRSDVARTPFATTPNVPLQVGLFPFSLPSMDRSKPPTFLYLWQPDPSMGRLSGK